MDNLLNNPALTSGTTLTTTVIAANLIIAAVLGIVTAVIYKQTHRGVSYSQSYVISLALLCIIATMIIMVIGNSLVTAIGLIGAFTIIRFRTAVKDTKDLTFMFLSLALGLAVGVRAYPIAVISLILIAVLLLIFDRIRFGSVSAYEYLLSFSTRTDQKDNPPYQKVFIEYLKDHILLNTRSYKEGQELEVTFNIVLKNQDKLQAFAQALSKIKQISKVELLSLKNDIEY